MENDTRPLTTRDVARMFSVTPSTVKRWVDDGKIPVSFRTFGGHARFDAAAIEQLREEQGAA